MAASGTQSAKELCIARAAVSSCIRQRRQEASGTAGAGEALACTRWAALAELSSCCAMAGSLNQEDLSSP